MAYNLLKSLIPLIEKYEQETGGKDDLQDFLQWAAGSKNNNLSRDRNGLDIPPGENLEGVLGKYIVFLYRYARSYVKKALEDTALSHFDDFAFLVTLFVDQALSKTALIQKNIMDKSSGSEIIKRLTRHGFMEEFPSELDKRSKLVRLTKEGTIALLQTFEKMGKVSMLISGSLSEAEKIQLFELLHKLHHFHLPIFMEQRHRSIDEIMKSGRA
ncbi:MAG: MarR family transcriptional regulator [Saprospiraceae bacterium]|jgi:DNA-binding MarR family transcriptional regulator|nr:MarR family transcriptional regulator [Saprospiraceae bacterium]